jgi:hypothetical protein
VVVAVAREEGSSGGAMRESCSSGGARNQGSSSGAHDQRSSSGGTRSEEQLGANSFEIVTGGVTHRGRRLFCATGGAWSL